MLLQPVVCLHFSTSSSQYHFGDMCSPFTATSFIISLWEYLWTCVVSMFRLPAYWRVTLGPIYHHSENFFIYLLQSDISHYHLPPEFIEKFRNVVKYILFNKTIWNYKIGILYVFRIIRYIYYKARLDKNNHSYHRTYIFRQSDIRQAAYHTKLVLNLKS